MNQVLSFTLAGLAFLASPAAVASPTAERAAILATIGRMEAAWNRGDFRGYMAGFKNPDVVFVSGGKFQDGWQGTLDHYIRDYGGSAERRGKLHFYNMKVDLLGPDAAMLIGQYRLQRGPRISEGVNTRLFRKVGGRWLITMNHVSAYDVTAPSAPKAR
jgi:ketosteroid isomerase-like protein